MKYTTEKIGTIIKHERNLRNMSQTNLGDMINVTGKQISNYEQNKLLPPMDVLFKLCEIFECELGYLLSEDDYSDSTSFLTKVRSDIGITPDSVLNIKRLIDDGNQSRNVNVLNRLLSNESFIKLIKSLVDLDEAYSNEKDFYSSYKIDGFRRSSQAESDYYGSIYLSKIARYEVNEAFANVIRTLYPMD